MADTPNHQYSRPASGSTDWDQPINANFTALDVDIEIRDSGTPGSNNYTPTDGAKYLDTTGGVVYTANGSAWTPTLAVARYTPGGGSTDAGSVVFGYSANSVGTDTSGATIAGGGAGSLVIGNPPQSNDVTGDYGTISGGFDNTASGGGAVIGGGSHNTAGGVDATIAGGRHNETAADFTTIAGGGPTDSEIPDKTSNAVYDNYGTISGGGNNQAGTDDGDTTLSEYATVSGGQRNVASDGYATVSGGQFNDADDYYATVGGGKDNVSSGRHATVAGGLRNTASEFRATVGGGSNNTASGSESTVAGGGGQLMGNSASANRATVGGGESNTASGEAATVPGGRGNVASGRFSFAAGDWAAADADWSFVWVDGSGESDSEGGESDQFSASTNDGSSDVNGQATFNVKATDGVRFVTATDNSAVTWISAGQSGWSSSCSRAVKTNVEPVDSEAMLEGVRSLSLNSWEYTDADGEGTGVRHVSPMAEEFTDTFDVGENDSGINSINADGVAFAAIQGLAKRLTEKDEQAETQADRIDELEVENERLREQNAELEDRLAAVEEHLGFTDGEPTHGVADD